MVRDDDGQKKTDYFDNTKKWLKLRVSAFDQTTVITWSGRCTHK